MRRKLRVLIIDEENLVREALCALIGRERDLEVSALAVGALATLGSDDVPGQEPDLVIVDFEKSPLGIPDSIGAIRQRWPGAYVLALTFRRERPIFEAALRAGAEGYLLKTDAGASLFAAVRAATAGKRFLSPTMVDGYADSATGLPRVDPDSDGLSNREREVMKLIALGHRTRDIAQQLSLSHKTIEKHRSNLMRKLGLKTAPAVAAFAITNGYLPQR